MPPNTPLPPLPARLDVPCPEARAPWNGSTATKCGSEGVFPPVGRSDHGISRTRLWMRDQPPRPLDFASLTALADVFFRASGVAGLDPVWARCR